MNWLNINLATLRSPAYMGSNPAERATWLQLLAYCVDQENGGCIAGGASWSVRQWQQTCGVTPRAVRGASRLVTIEGDDVRVAFFPLEKQYEVQTRRAAATEAANRRWHGKLRGERGGSGENGDDTELAADSGDAPPHASRIAPVHAEEKENGKEEKEKEKGMNASPAGGAPQVRDPQPAEDAGSPGRLCSLRLAILHGMRLTPPCPEQWASKWWEDCEKRGWVDNHGIALRQWQPALSSYWRGVQEQDRRSGALPGAGGEATASSVSTHPRLERPMSAYEVKVRLEAIDAELGRIRQKARDGRSEDGLQTIKLYTPEEEARRAQLKQAKEILKRKLTEV